MVAGLNTQRRVSEGSSRYAFPLLPVAILCASAQPGHVELFVCGADLPARQVRLDLRRPALALVRGMIEAAVWRRPGPRRRGTMIDWGLDGNELCCRYFVRYRDRLTWLSIDLSAGTDAIMHSIVQAAEGCLLNSVPAEFRLEE
jgi:hypothetical protein